MNTRRVLMPYIIARGGGTIADQGLACGLAAFLEVPAMLLLVRLRNDRSKEILAIVCILELAAYLLLTLLGSTTIFVVTYCITGFCYGLKMATARKAIYQSRLHLCTRADKLVQISLTTVFSGLVGSFLGGSDCRYAGVKLLPVYRVRSSQRGQRHPMCGLCKKRQQPVHARFTQRQSGITRDCKTLTHAKRTGNKKRHGCLNPGDSTSMAFVTWRKRWDSNPRALSDNRISSAARYDHFDTLPQGLIAGTGRPG